MAHPRNPHIGGEQLPLITPNSSWRRPEQLPDLRRCPEVALDRETKDEGLAAGRGPGWPYRAGYICGSSVAWDEGGAVRAAYFPVRHPDSDCFDPEQVAQWERDHIAAGVRFIYHNSNYDIGWGLTDGVPAPPSDQIDDTTAMAVLDDENRLSYGLDSICRWLGIPGKDEALMREAAAAYGYHGAAQLKKNLWRMAARYVGPYAEADAISTLRASHLLRPRLERQDTYRAYRLEMDLVPLVLEMRRRGVRVDTARAEAVRRDCLEQRDAVFRELRDKLGEPVGMEEIGRTKWLERVFAAHAPDIRIPRTAPTRGHPNGQPSFTAGSTGWMQKNPHWLPTLIVRADKLNNFASKFLQGFILDYAHRGRLHANVNQFLSEDDLGSMLGTRTFRFSYSDPALQQMPSRDEVLAPLIRGCFLPEPGGWWCRVDYSQQEYRLIVHFAALLGCTRAEDAVAKYVSDPDTDYHSMVAEMTGLDRKPAKDTNFAKSYGAGIPRFASMINKSLEEARAIMEQYDREMPFVKELMQRAQKLADKRGYIRLLDGARSHFDQWEPAWRDEGEGYAAPARTEEEARPRWPGRRIKRAFTKDAGNRLIQGSAARQTKLAMRACWREGIVPLLQVHDELDFSFSTREEGEHAAQIMRDVVQLRVPMSADTEWGTNWGNAKRSWDEREAA